MTIDDARVMAYVDGELHPAEMSAFEQEMQDSVELRDAVMAQRVLRDRITGRYASIEQEPVPENIAALFSKQPAPVIDFAAEKAKRAPRPRTLSVSAYGAMAATLVAGIIFGQLLPHPSGSPVVERGGTLVAHADVARALDTQLASVSSDQAVGIGVSFRNKAGAYCRTFDAPTVAGIACQERGRWQVLNALFTPKQAAASNYRQAGSTNPQIMQAAQDMMAGEPLNVAQEQQARAAGWH
jgi:hypothetical protein